MFKNKAIVFSILLVVLSLILLAIPGQFAHGTLVGKEFTYKFSGYEFFFNTKTSPTGNEFGKVVPAGIALIVMLPLSIVGLCFSKKSSFVTLVSGLALFTCAVLFFTMEPSARDTYGVVTDEWVTDDYGIINWVSYVNGSLVIIASALTIYTSIKMMKDEIKRPAKPNGPSFNYLKK